MENILAEIRKQHKMTQQELADILEVSRQTIISLESGKYNPSLELAFKLSKQFRMPIEKIFIFKGEE